MERKELIVNFLEKEGFNVSIQALGMLIQIEDIENKMKEFMLFIRKYRKNIVGQDIVAYLAYNTKDKDGSIKGGGLESL